MLKQKLIKAINEKDVENIYRSELLIEQGAEISSPYAVDGLLTTKNIRSLLEFKYDDKLKGKLSQCNILIQCLYYLKKFEDAGDKLPTTIFVGDKNECFALHTNSIVKYLSSEINWKIAPSEAYKKNPELIQAMVDDINILPFVYDIDEDFHIKTALDKIKDLSDNVIRKVRCTKHNIVAIFDYFNRNILSKVSLTTNEKANLFIQIIINPNENCLHPRKKNLLITKSFGDLQLSENLFKSFFQHFEGDVYGPKEKEGLTSLVDRLVDDTTRRNKGEFFTPTPFVDLAHKYVSDTFGEDWKDKFVVWDCCYDEETEFFNGFEWKKISNYTEDDLVLQYNSEGISTLVKPKKYIKQIYNGNWLTFNNANSSIKTTEDHDYVLKNNKKRTNKLFKMKALDVFNEFNRVKDTHLVLPITFEYNGSLEIDENILRLAVAINADGSYNKYLTLGNHKDRTKRNTRFTENDTSDRDVFCISVKKERKISRCEFLLNQAKIEYVKNKPDKNEFVSFYFKFPFNAKLFPNEWYNLTKKCKEIILDEILNWDGTIQKGVTLSGRNFIRKTYSTSKKSDFDFIQFCAHSIGLSINVREDKRGKKNINYQIALKEKQKTIKISNKNNTFIKEKSNDDYCYCFTVDSGMLIMRRNNKIFISGNCWGTGNLTRDYKFKELYCSTLEQSDIDTANQMGYNNEAVKFQYDFLNDGDEKLPQGLQDAINNGKEILFLINPPYATDANFGESKKDGVFNTIVNKMMNEEGYGKASSNLYSQFLHKIIKYQEVNKNIKIGIFSPPLFLTGGSYKMFRSKFFNVFSSEKGFLFESSHFSDVAKGWGISFTIFNSGKNKYNSFKINVIDYNSDFELYTIQQKELYNTDEKNIASDWCKDLSKNEKIESINFKSALNLRLDPKIKCYLLKNSIGGFYNGGNNVDKNDVQVSLFNGVFKTSTMSCTSSITPLNYYKVCNLFSARKLISKNWINCKDEYLAPNEQHPDYEQFTYDSIVYSLFNNSSQQSSLRQVDYKDKKWDIKNEFFWMDKNFIQEIANENHYDELYKDAKTGDNRYVHNLLFGEQNIYEKLSPDAKNILDQATELVKKSIKIRKMVSEEHPEYHLNSFDAGYAQLKLVWKEYFKDEFKVFRNDYKKFEDRLRPLVYELGFLRK